MGQVALVTTDAERAYRGRALKRVVAARDLSVGTVIAAADLTLLRPAQGAGLFDPAHAVGHKLMRALTRHDPVNDEDLAR